jgi:hypothetical protein
MSAQLAWPAVVLAAFVLFWAPLVIALIRGTERVSTVVLLTMLTLLIPPAWFAALAAPFVLPRKQASRPGRTVPPHLAARPGWYPAGPQAGPAAARTRQDRTAAGSRGRP